MQITRADYDELTGKVAKLTADLATVTKERDEAVRLKDIYYKKSNDLEHDVARLHTFLSALPDAPPSKPDGAASYDPELPVPERLAIWLAKRMK